MKNRSFQKAINLVFTLALTFGLLLPGSTTLALPQKADDITIQGIMTPNDPRYVANEQWNLSGTWGINAPAAWNITNGSSDVIVAVIDTGITTHEDLDGARILPGWDFVSDDHRANDSIPGRDSEPIDMGDWIEPDDISSGFFTGCSLSDSSWNGTRVAGIIGAASNNSTGIAGINWAAKILPVRVVGKCGTGGTVSAQGFVATDIVDGMSRAAGLVVPGTTQRTKAGDPNNYPAHVLNVSVSVPGLACTNYQTAINNIIATGAVVVAAAGDNNASTSNFPANCDGVITVAATDAEGSRSGISNFGPTVEISAPGGGNTLGDVLSTSNISTTTPDSTGPYSVYTTKEGTGMAAAHVSGVVSLMLSGNPAMTSTQIWDTLKRTATAFPVTSTCTTTCGYGIVNAGAALRPDLIITNVFLTPRNASNLCPDTDGVGHEISPPASPYSPLPTVPFCVYVRVKNKGGSNSGSISYRNVYIGRNPSSLVMDADGCLEDSGDYFRQDLNGSIPAGAEVTLAVPITNGLPAGTYPIYAYTDAQCIVTEVIEDNNNFAPVIVTVGTTTGGDTAGVFRPSNATFYLRNSNSAGSPNLTVKLGKTGDYPVVGDWNGDGTDTIGIYRNGIFYLSNSNTTGHVDLTFAFGVAGDQPIAGDWNGDGKDTIGIYRSTKITFLLRNTNSAGAADATFKLGVPGDVGIAGDWNADGKDSTGVFRPSNGALYFKNANSTGYADIVTVYGIKNDRPVTGDWEGDGDATIGIYRSAKFYLRNTNTRGYADFSFLFGAIGDMPLAGNWDGVP